jgi:hypothetical protein
MKINVNLPSTKTRTLKVGDIFRAKFSGPLSWEYRLVTEYDFKYLAVCLRTGGVWNCDDTLEGLTNAYNHGFEIITDKVELKECRDEYKLCSPKL